MFLKQTSKQTNNDSRDREKANSLCSNFILVVLECNFGWEDLHAENDAYLTAFEELLSRHHNVD